MIYHKVKSNDLCNCDRCEKCGKLIAQPAQSISYFVSYNPNAEPYIWWTTSSSNGTTITVYENNGTTGIEL